MIHWRAIFLFLLSFFLGLPAHATRSRLLVLGSGDPIGVLDGYASGSGGSLLLEDRYNLFYNPALIQAQEEWIVVEKSNFPGELAQGGFTLKAFEGLALGFYFNRTSQLPSFENLNHARPIDLVMGIQPGESTRVGWGVSAASYALSGRQDLYLNTFAGMEWEGLEVFGNYLAYGVEKSPGVTTKNLYRRWGGGIRYQLAGWRPYLMAHSARKSSNRPARTVGIGIARNTDVGLGVTLNYSAGIWRAWGSNRNVVPLDFSFEGRVLEWLTLRGGLGFQLYDRMAGTSLADQTTGRFGLMARFDPIDFSFAIGRNSSSLETSTAPDSQNFGLSDGFFTAASLLVRY